MKVVKFKSYLLFAKCNFIIFILWVELSSISLVLRIENDSLISLFRLIWGWDSIPINDLILKPL